MIKTTFSLKMPENKETSVVFAVPHSGREYDRKFKRKSILDEKSIRTSEDAFVDMLFDTAPKYGAVFLAAKFPRAFVDLNRNVDELDPALIEGLKKNTTNPRVASGLGVIPRVVSGGRAIYRGKITHDEALKRIADYWHPYHDILHRIMARNLSEFGQAVLVDCHSMPHEALDAIARSGAQRPDVVIGDRFGASASEAIVCQIEEIFRAQGLRVLRNMPFAGAYITKEYGRISANQHAVQIEIDRSLYMNEQMIRPNGNFNAFRKMMQDVTGQIADIGRVEARMAAE
ncbi:N-formylglutamate amidohydrolase [Falsihalocynthiibacter sp. BN13B15]|uniref:N-formylglutamate amidohydrolase n=1 Tax=Falsihalocynthiibacter sp. BN13B15 TaxID=3240871 RepID=UPI00350EAE83